MEPKIVAYFKGRCSLRNELANLRFPSEVTETGRTLVHDMMRLVPFAFSADQKFIERVREGEREREGRCQ